jgi:hypothetical protein
MFIKFWKKLIHVGGNQLIPRIQKLINSIYHKEELSEMWKESTVVLVFTRKVMRETVVGNYRLKIPHRMIRARTRASAVRGW